MPAIEVMRVDGQPCHGFQTKVPASPLVEVTRAPDKSHPMQGTSAPVRIHSTRLWQA